MAKKKPSVKALFLVIDGAFYDVRRPTTTTWNGFTIDPATSFVLKKGDGTTLVVGREGCSCQGFGFKHDCKHVRAMQDHGLLSVAY